jgi:hypothetical protein
LLALREAVVGIRNRLSHFDALKSLRGIEANDGKGVLVSGDIADRDAANAVIELADRCNVLDGDLISNRLLCKTRATLNLQAPQEELAAKAMHDGNMLDTTNIPGNDGIDEADIYPPSA